MRSQLLKDIVFDIIKDAGKITKREIKSRVFDIAAEQKILTKEFFVAFGDIGWVFQDLRQKDKVVVVEKLGKEHYWSIA